MYKENSTFIQPENENIMIWRYMDFAKFNYLLENKKLFFARVDKFDDQFEGSWPKKSSEVRNQFTAGSSEEDRRLKIIALKERTILLKQYFAVSCWHANECESAAMWILYLKSNAGIAVQSTYKLLKSSLVDTEDIFLGKVTYLNYQTETIKFYDPIAPFMHKRMSFEHEREIRALTTKRPLTKEKQWDLSLETIKDGLPISVDLRNLVQKIYVAPNSPEWFLEMVLKAVKKYHYTWEVKQSTMDDNPWF